jgi:hypothetical protein
VQMVREWAQFVVGIAAGAYLARAAWHLTQMIGGF